MRTTLMIGMLLVSLIAIVGTASAANLIANGGFESPVNTASWQIYPDGYSGLIWAADPELEIQTASTLGLVPFEGIQYAELDPNYNVRISQVIPVAAGKTYLLSYAQSCRSDDPNIEQIPSTLGVYWGSDKIAETTCTKAQALIWAPHTVTITPASDGDVKLTFADEGYSDSYGVLLDDVILETETVPAPEFPTLALPAGLLVGLIGAVFLLRGTREN